MTPPATQARRLVLAGVLALAVAMGIGRFAFTPLLPMMLSDGVIELAAAGWLASANYLGYMAGAVLCTFQPWIWRRLGWHVAIDHIALARTGLVATVVLTLAMALPLPAAWPVLRFLAGVASALVFIYGTGWCLARLSRLQQPALGALMFTGPGAGIVLSGVAASGMVALQWRATTGWLIFGLLAAALTAVVWPIFGPRGGGPAAPAGPATGHVDPRSPSHGWLELACLALAYGISGFGYIITATFLPVIARQAIPGSPLLDLFWPMFGLGVVFGALIASRMHPATDLRWRLAACYLLQALAIAIGLWSPTSGGFALGSILLGLPFTAITFFGMQEARRLAPAQPASLMGLLTAVFGFGQIVGPPLATALAVRSASPGAGFDLALWLAAASLVAGASAFVTMIRVYPVRTAT